jgi:hypothetical protein
MMWSKEGGALKERYEYMTGEKGKGRAVRHKGAKALA